MKSFLKYYLIATGAGAAFVTAFPFVVILGYFLLLAPGIVLSFLPTAFLYGLVVAAVFFPLERYMREAVAGAIAIIGAILLMVAIPMPGNLVTQARHDRELAGDMLPAQKINLRGAIRIESTSQYDAKNVAARRAAYARADRAPAKSETYGPASKLCSDLCAALLFTEGVLSVTVNRDTEGLAAPLALAPGAVTFTRTARGRCSATVLPQSGGDLSGWTGRFDKLHERWKLRLSTGDCIEASRPVQNFDLRIVSSHLITPLPAESRSGEDGLGSRPVRIERLEILDAHGHTLLRQTRARAAWISVPLMYLPDGGLENFRFRWASRSVVKGRYEDFKPGNILATQTNLDLTGGNADTTGDTGNGRNAAGTPGFDQQLIRRLTEVMNDSSTPASDPVFKLINAFFEPMAKRRATPEEIALTLKLIADKRVSEFNGVWILPKAMPAESTALRTVIVARLLQADAVKDRSLRALGGMVKSLPSGAFTQPVPGEAELLRDPERRTLAAGFIERQADRGATAAPELAAIIGEQLKLRDARRASIKSYNDVDHSQAIDGAIGGLIRLGPAAASVLPAIEALEQSGLANRNMRDSRDWHMLLARLGRPIESIPKPQTLSNSEESFRNNMRQRLARYERTGERF